MNMVRSVWKNMSMIMETRVHIPKMVKMAGHPRIGTTVLFRMTPSREAMENPQKNKAFTLTPNLYRRKQVKG